MNKYGACCLILLIKSSFLNTMDRTDSWEKNLNQKQRKTEEKMSCCSGALCCPIIWCVFIGYGIEKTIQANHRLGAWLGCWSNKKTRTPLTAIVKGVDTFLNSKKKLN